MFIRTDRLFLRPAWLEDAAELTRAVAHELVVRMLARAPWPYNEDDARAFVESQTDPRRPGLLVTLPGEAGRIIGGIGLHEEEGHTLAGYWIAPDCWGRGYATEALRGLLTLARLLGHRRIGSRHAADNPASGRVMRKAGFTPTGRSRPFPSLGHRESPDAFEYALELGEAADSGEGAMPKAA